MLSIMVLEAALQLATVSALVGYAAFQVSREIQHCMPFYFVYLPACWFSSLYFRLHFNPQLQLGSGQVLSADFLLWLMYDILDPAVHFCTGRELCDYYHINKYH